MSPISVRAQFVTATIPAGNSPDAIAVNPVTNKVYVANYYGGGMTVIDAATNETSTLAAENNPRAVAVNSQTNTIYVANFNSGDLTVIDGTTNAETSVPVGTSPDAIAINSVTNKVYVECGGGITIVDGATNAVTPLPLESGSGWVAVNEVTNRIYVGSGDSVAVVDGATNLTTIVPVGTDPYAIAINPVTNKIYVANYNQGGAGSVTVIDGATNTTVSVPVGSQPGAIAVDPVTNKVYVANYGADGGSTGSGVTVIDGLTNTTAMLSSGSEPDAIAVNPVTDQVYVANFASSTLTVIDGATNAETSVPVGPGPEAISVNTVTNTIYTANSGGNTGTVTVINGAAAASNAGSARITNVSARAVVGTGANVLIPGFVIGGSGEESLLIRASGPSLAQFGLSGVLARPSLSVFDDKGHFVASNTGWESNENPAQIASDAAQVGAFAFAPGSADCAVEVGLPAGAYTVQVSGVDDSNGLALAEVYEVASAGTRLVNISTRAQVGAGEIIVLGVGISGTASGSEVMLMRADGPGLTQFGITGVLAQPSMSVFDRSGGVVASNTGWGHSFEEDLIAGFAAAIGAFPLAPGSPDSAQFVTLSPGTYTMQVSGANNTTGVALAEAYEEQ